MTANRVSWFFGSPLGLLIVAFIVTGVGTPDGLGTDSLGGSGDTIATIDGEKLRASEIRRRGGFKVRAAHRLDTARVDWSVLTWNEPAIGFYRRIGAIPLEEWRTYRLTGSALASLAR